MQSVSADPFDGILLVDKPSGPTSHDVVDRIRRHFRFRKVGHGGTLDPQATGLLLLLLGRGTKFSQALMSGDKTYEGVMRLGLSTDTQDAQGKPLQERDWGAVTRDAVEAGMRHLQGDIYQIPPMVSAVKKNGVPLYKMARRGQSVERDPKLIHVYEFRIVEFAPPRVSFLLRSSKGTYVRTLCHDLGESLGCGAHLEQLRRTWSGPFGVEEALRTDQILAMTPMDLLPHVIPLYRLRETLRREGGHPGGDPDRDPAGTP